MENELKNNFEKLKIDTGRLMIRRIQNDDKEDFFEMYSDTDTAINDGARPYLEMNEKFESDFEYLVSDEMHYTIELKECHKMIGIMHLTEIRERAVKCYEIGHDIHHGFRRKGYATEAIKGILEYGFNVLDAEIFTATVYDWNKESVSLLNKLGFVLEGKIHKAEKHFKFGVVDVLSFYKDK